MKCLCGCGQEVNNLWVKGHGNRGRKFGPTSDETKEKISIKMSGKNNPMYGKTHTPEAVEKIIAANINKVAWNKGLTKETDKRITYGRSKEKNSMWKGGNYDYWHLKSWKMFGKDYCEKCGINLKKYKDKYGYRFDMHNTLDPKDYTVMKSEAWQCLCRVCHRKVESDN